MCYIYIALFWVLKALYIEGGGGDLLNHHQLINSIHLFSNKFNLLIALIQYLANNLQFCCKFLSF